MEMSILVLCWCVQTSHPDFKNQDKLIQLIQFIQILRNLILSPEELQKQETVVCLHLILLLLSKNWAMYQQTSCNMNCKMLLLLPATRASYNWSDAMQSWHLIMLKQQQGHFYSHLSQISKRQHRGDMLKLDTGIKNMNTNEQETQVCANAATESAYWHKKACYIVCGTEELLLWCVL